MKIATLDFETAYSQEYSLSHLTTEMYIRDPRFEVIGVAVKVNNYPTDWITGTMEQIKHQLRSLDWSDTMLLCHNTAFDGAILKWHFGITPWFFLDTMSMARPEYGVTVGCSLAALAKHFGVGEKGDEVVAAKGKWRKDFSPQELALYGQYCINDVELTHAIFNLLKVGFSKQELKLIDCMLRMFIDPVLELDGGVLESHLVNVLTKKESLLADLGVHKDDLMSNDKFADVLRKLNVEPPLKVSAKTGKEAYAFAKTDTEFLALLEHDDPQVQAVVAARLGVKSTLEETRTNAFIGISKRGPLPIMLNYYGGHTGRASGGDKINLQNLPRGGALRDAIRAPNGHVLVACDSSQIEARITAYLAEQTDLVNAFRNGDDVYSMFASDVYGRKVDRRRKEIGPDGKEFKPDEIPGFVGKTCILGLGFGTGWKKLQHTLKVAKERLEITDTEAMRIVRLYRNKYSKITHLWYAADKAMSSIMENTEFRFGANDLLYTSKEGIHLPNGMLMRYTGLMDSGEKGAFFAKTRKEYIALGKMRFLYKTDPDEYPMEWEKLTYIYGPKIVENVVQALARIVVMDQMIEIGKYFKPVLTVHDEVVCCVPETEAVDAEQLMTKVMSTPPRWAPDLPIACEAGMGVSYGDAK